VDWHTDLNDPQARDYVDGERFARVVRYREDKRPAEADTVESVEALRAGGSG
jgi:ATP-dependent DNA ligase